MRGDTAMKTREEYIDKMAEQLKAWSAGIDELQDRVSVVRADMKAGYESRIREIRDRREAVARKIQELGETSEEAWDALRVVVDCAWLDFTDALTSARDNFRKAA
jgi:uncharacterized coiled-coil DUF342 family protein